MTRGTTDWKVLYFCQSEKKDELADGWHALNEHGTRCVPNKHSQTPAVEGHWLVAFSHFSRTGRTAFVELIAAVEVSESIDFVWASEPHDHLVLPNLSAQVRRRTAKFARGIIGIRRADRVAAVH